MAYIINYTTDISLYLRIRLACYLLFCKSHGSFPGLNDGKARGEPRFDGQKLDESPSRWTGRLLAKASVPAPSNLLPAGMQGRNDQPADD